MTTHFTDEYKEEVFQDWFAHGQLGGVAYHGRFLKPDKLGNIPGLTTLKGWILNEFSPRADKLNEQIKLELEGRIVQEKVEMLARHAEIGKEITEKALNFLSENEFTTSASALRALVEGIRIERESRGLPDALAKMTTSSDEDLVKEVEKLLEKTTIVEPDDEEE